MAGKELFLDCQREGTLFRLGDLAALMTVALCRKLIFRDRVHFNYRQPNHQALHLDRLFATVIDHFDPNPPPDQAYWDTGPLWITAPALLKQYGPSILPRPYFDPDLYTGPELPRGPYCIFAPLFAPPYNLSRGMGELMANLLIEELTTLLGEQLIVVTDQPERITVPSTRIFPATNTYNLLHLIQGARGFIGGDTGFSHFAGLARCPLLVSIYGHNSYGVTSDHGEAWSSFLWNSLPASDPASSEHHIHLMQDNHLIGLQRFAIVQAVRRHFPHV